MVIRSHFDTEAGHSTHAFVKKKENPSDYVSALRVNANFYPENLSIIETG